jgi:hypothetical protein
VGITLAGMVAWKGTRRAAAMDRMTVVMVEDELADWQTNLMSDAVSSAWNAGPATSWKPFRGSAGRAGRARMWIL